MGDVRGSFGAAVIIADTGDIYRGRVPTEETWSQRVRGREVWREHIHCLATCSAVGAARKLSLRCIWLGRRER